MIERKITRKKKLKLFYLDHYALTMSFSPRKNDKIFCFPLYNLYSHHDLICYLWKDKLHYNEGNFHMILSWLITNMSILRTVREVMSIFFDRYASIVQWIKSI